MKNLSKRGRLYLAISSVWLFINVIVYIMSSPVHTARSHLYPFSNFYDWSLESIPNHYTIFEAYDFSEFLLYGITPFFLFAIHKIFLKK